MRIEEAVHVELAVLVMDAQNALEFVTRALTLEARALMDVASHHQQETVKTVRLPGCHSEVYWEIPDRAVASRYPRARACGGPRYIGLGPTAQEHWAGGVPGR